MNRAFIYGDLLFETIKVVNGKPVLAHAHYERLRASAELLQMNFSVSFETFVEAIEKAVQKESKQEARVRFVLHRDAEGFYTPATNHTNFLVDVFAMPETREQLRIGLFTELYKPCHGLSNLKTGNALIYTMAGLWAKQQGLDDALILNEHGCICEATSSNVFIVKGEQVLTPTLSEGCVDGVMRKHLIRKLKQADYTLTETMITLEQLEQADAVFLTNAIQGVMSVKQFEGIEYSIQSL